VRDLFGRKILVASALAALMGSASSLLMVDDANALLIIDTFNNGATPTFFPPPPPPGPADYQENVAGVLDGYREIRIDTSPLGTTAGVISGRYQIQNSAPDNFSSPPTTSVSTRIRWDGIGNTPGNTVPNNFSTAFDATQGGINTFVRLVARQNDLGGLPPNPPADPDGNNAILSPQSTIAFTLWNGTTNATVSKLLPYFTTGTLNYDFNFSDFIAGGFTLADLSNITAVELNITLYGEDEAAFTLSLDQAEFNVPFEFSPALGVVSLGALFVFSYIRKKRKSSASIDLEASKPEINSLVN